MSKIYKSKEEYETELKSFEDGRSRVRKWFLRSKLGTLPPGMRPIEGCEYKRLDDFLQGEIDRIEQKWKTTRWLWSQPKEGARRHRYMDTGDSQLKWRVISEGEAKKRMAQPGSMVRTMGEGKNQRWEGFE